MIQIIALLLLWVNNGNNTQEKDAILGVWLADDRLSKVQMYETEGKYHGKVIWLKHPTENGKPVLDKHNENTHLRDKPVMGLILLKNFSYQANFVWNGGTVYDPRSGKTYSCKLSLRNRTQLDVRGYIGNPIFGKTVTFTRVEE